MTYRTIQIKLMSIQLQKKFTVPGDNFEYQNTCALLGGCPWHGAKEISPFL